MFFFKSNTVCFLFYQRIMWAGCKNIYLKYHILFLFLSFTIFQTLPSTVLSYTPNYTAAKVVKWYPGHYHFKDDSGYNAADAESFLKKMQNVANMRGFQVTYDWKSLEATAGVYDFHLIDKDLNLLKKYGKKLSIIIGFKYQVLPTHIYDIAPENVGGVMVPSFFYQIVSRSTGDIANFGHPKTLERFSNLVKAIAQKYDKDLGLAYVQITETASSMDRSKYPNASQLELNYLTGVYKLHKLMGTAFAHTPVIQSLNSPRPELANFMDSLASLNMGFGGPDTFFGAYDSPDDPLTKTNADGSNPGIYHFNTDNNGIMPIGMQIHHNNLLFSSLLTLRASPPRPHNLSGAVSVDKVYALLYQKLEANFAAWQVYNSDSHKAAWENRLLDGSLPLFTACPKIYLSCNYDGSTPDPVPTPDPAPVINRAPYVSNRIGEKQWTQRQYHSFTIPIGTFTDPDGDKLTYRARQANGDALPTWMKFDPSTRKLSGTPPRRSRDFTIRIRVQDPSGLSAFEDIVIRTPTQQ